MPPSPPPSPNPVATWLASNQSPPSPLTRGPPAPSWHAWSINASARSASLPSPALRRHALSTSTAVAHLAASVGAPPPSRGPAFSAHAPPHAVLAHTLALVAACVRAQRDRGDLPPRRADRALREVAALEAAVAEMQRRTAREDGEGDEDGERVACALPDEAEEAETPRRWSSPEQRRRQSPPRRRRGSEGIGAWERFPRPRAAVGQIGLRAFLGARLALPQPQPQLSSMGEEAGDVAPPELRLGSAARAVRGGGGRVSGGGEKDVRDVFAQPWVVPEDEDDDDDDDGDDDEEDEDEGGERFSDGASEDALWGREDDSERRLGDSSFGRVDEGATVGRDADSSRTSNQVDSDPLVLDEEAPVDALAYEVRTIPQSRLPQILQVGVGGSEKDHALSGGRAKLSPRSPLRKASPPQEKDQTRSPPQIVLNDADSDSAPPKGALPGAHINPSPGRLPSPGESGPENHSCDVVRCSSGDDEEIAAAIRSSSTAESTDPKAVTLDSEAFGDFRDVVDAVISDSNSEECRTGEPRSNGNSSGGVDSGKAASLREGDTNADTTCETPAPNAQNFKSTESREGALGRLEGALCRLKVSEREQPLSEDRDWPAVRQSTPIDRRDDAHAQGGIEAEGQDDIREAEAGQSASATQTLVLAEEMVADVPPSGAAGSSTLFSGGGASTTVGELGDYALTPSLCVAEGGRSPRGRPVVAPPTSKNLVSCPAVLPPNVPGPPTYAAPEPHPRTLAAVSEGLTQRTSDTLADGLFGRRRESSSTADRDQTASLSGTHVSSSSQRRSSIVSTVDGRTRTEVTSTTAPLRFCNADGSRDDDTGEEVAEMDDVDDLFEDTDEDDEQVLTSENDIHVCAADLRLAARTAGASAAAVAGDRPTPLQNTENAAGAGQAGGEPAAVPLVPGTGNRMVDGSDSDDEDEECFSDDSHSTLSDAAFVRVESDSPAAIGLNPTLPPWSRAAPRHNFSQQFSVRAPRMPMPENNRSIRGSIPSGNASLGGKPPLLGGPSVSFSPGMLDGPISGGPLSGGPLSGGAASAGPASGGPVSGGPVSGGPLSGGGLTLSTSSSSGNPNSSNTIGLGASGRQRVLSARFISPSTSGMLRGSSSAVLASNSTAAPPANSLGDRGISMSTSMDRVVTSEHFSRTASVGFLARNESARSNSAAQPEAPFNPAQALRVTFVSVNSFGNTELSFDVGDDGAPASGRGGAMGGGLLGGAPYGPSPSFGKPRSFLSEVPRPTGVPTLVAEAAGSLYRSGSIDERWLFGQMVGEGAFSEVRLGEGRQGGGRVAIKVISKGAPDLFGEGSMCREVLAFQTIGRHANIVECIEVCEDDKYVYVVLELLTGGLLLPRIANSEQYYPRYDERDAAHVVRGIISALAYCHDVGVAHRDVKPDNILFVCEGMDKRLKLSDFGIAHCSPGPCTELCGTPLYVAPEVMLRRPYSFQADMWSVAVICHILLVGYPPFDDDDLVQLINKVKFQAVRLSGPEWGVVSDSGKDFVTKLLVRDPSKRLTAQMALAHPWMIETANDASRGDAWPHLQDAQQNLQDFVMNREFKRVVQHEHAQSALRLHLLVSLSEGSIHDRQAGEGSGIAIGESASSAALPDGEGAVPFSGRTRMPQVKPNGQRYGRDALASGGLASSSDAHGRQTYDAGSSARELDLAAKEIEEQAELRRKRLDLEDKLRRQRSHDTRESPTAPAFSTKSGSTLTSSMVTSSAPTASPISQSLVDADSTSGEVVPGPIGEETTTRFLERRNADADEDWARLRGRADKEMRKVSKAAEKPPRRNRLRRPTMFGKGKASSKSSSVRS